MSEWLQKRGISVNTFAHFKIEVGYYKNKEGVIYPVKDYDGTPIATRYKAKDKNSGAKYIWVEGVAPFYNSQVLKDFSSVWIANGEPSVWVLHEAGLPAFCWFGESNIPEDILDEYLNHFGVKELNIAPDQDFAGYNACFKLKQYIILRVPHIKLNIYDFGVFKQMGFDHNDLWVKMEFKPNLFLEALNKIPLITDEELRRRAGEALAPLSLSEGTLNPKVVEALDNYARTHGKKQPKNAWGLLSPFAHSHDKEGRHFTYYEGQSQGFEWSAWQWVGAKDLCQFWGIDIKALGGLFINPQRHKKASQSQDGNPSPTTDKPIGYAHYEKALLLGVLENHALIYQLAEGLKPAYFSHEDYQVIFEAMLHLKQLGERITRATIEAQLASQGLIMPTLSGQAADADSIKTYMRLITEAWYLTQISNLVDEAQEEIGKPQAKPLEIARKMSNGLNPILSLSNFRKPVTLSEAMDIWECRYLEQNNSHSFVIKTGLKAIDDSLGGLYKDELGVMIADTGIGKSYLLHTIAYQTAQPHFDKNGDFIHGGHRVYIVTPEMASYEVAARINAQLTDIPAFKQRAGSLNDEELGRILIAQEMAKQVWANNIMIDDLPITSFRTMASRFEEQHNENPFNLLIVDYAQIIRSDAEVDEHINKGRKNGQGNNQNRNAELGKLALGLKALARTYGISVILTSQVNREGSKSDDGLKLSSIRDSGEIAQNCDWGGAIERLALTTPNSNADDRRTTFTVLKARGGHDGTKGKSFVMWFNYLSGKFQDEKPPDMPKVPRPLTR